MLFIAWAVFRVEVHDADRADRIPSICQSVLEKSSIREASRIRLESEATVWTDKRDAKEAKLDWSLATADARIILEKLYASIEYEEAIA